MKNAKSLIAAVLVSAVISSGCSPSSKRTISCMNESGETQWSDGTIQSMSSNLGNELFTWFKDEGTIELPNQRQGSEVKAKVPARQNGEKLVFSSGRTTYMIDTTNGKLLSTSTGESPDGNFVLRMQGKCYGYN